MQKLNSVLEKYKDAAFIEEFITNKGKDYLGLYLSLATLLVVVVGLLFANNYECGTCHCCFSYHSTFSEKKKRIRINEIET